ncbi:MAG: hypothetical protein HY774_08680 [Acidobacteria bacterium]|nr:hypothetical protein [Acidobacteriota bacterium]
MSDYKILLNNNLLGGNIGVVNERRFHRVENLPSPLFNPKYFEAIPSAWAGAYSCKKLIEAEQSRRRHTDRELTQEWVCLFLLHYCGLAHLETFPRGILEKEFDPDLWPALSGTYPNPKQDESLRAVHLLKMDDGTVIGGYYPETVFFPSRGRSTWSTSKLLAPYLKETHLSWERCRELLLSEKTNSTDQSQDIVNQDSIEKRVHVHLRTIAKKVLENTMRTALDSFCEGAFGPLEKSVNVDAIVIDWDPGQWNTLGNAFLKEPKACLEKYPFQRQRNGGTTYYLISGMPQLLPWMTTPLEIGMPSPAQFQRLGPRTIGVEFAGKEVEFQLDEQSDVVLLKDFFLADAPYWCRKPASSLTRRLHEVEVHDVGETFSVLKPGEIAICLAPVKQRLLEHFPELLQRPDADIWVSGNGIDWTFTLLGKEIAWRTEPVFSKLLQNANLTLWPPKVSQDWKLYLAYGFGAKKRECGQWVLIDEQGTPARQIEVDDETYISLLTGSDRPNRPYALMLRDSGNRERGVAFVSKLVDQPARGIHHAHLGVDFGTSNTALAYKVTGDPAPLNFSLSPAVVWGAGLGLEIPGIIPSKWESGKGFFPTILLDLKSANLHKVKPEDIQLEHLFQADIPSLHKGMGTATAEAQFEDAWNTRPGTILKWNSVSTTGEELPFREIFLQLTLLYAHAEVFFSYKEPISEYVFTFPLAFTETQAKNFHKEARQAITKVRSYCYGSTLAGTFDYGDKLDESTAIANSQQAIANPGIIDVFIDVGGGTADLAVRYDQSFLVLDSIKVAGEAFFRFTEKNFEPPAVRGSEIFRRVLAGFLRGVDHSLTRDELFGKLPTGVCYSLHITNKTNDAFAKGEATILDRLENPSFQWYRARLFFQHLILYGLLQTCAAAVNQKLILGNGRSPKIQLILSGNGWGLLAFAKLERSANELRREAQAILALIKSHLMKAVVDEVEIQYLRALEIQNVILLNQEDLKKAKTSVAIGAITRLEGQDQAMEVQSKPYTGITLKNLQVNEFPPVTMRWCDHWSFDAIKDKIGKNFQTIEKASTEELQDYEQPMDPILPIFTLIGNTRNPDVNLMPPEEWSSLNAVLQQGVKACLDFKSKQSPLGFFLSRLLYPEDRDHKFLNVLAEKDGNYR